MYLLMTPTDEFVIVEGAMCRVWNGITPGGALCRVFVRGVLVESGQDQAEFQAALSEAPVPPLKPLGG